MPADPCDRLASLLGEQLQCDLWLPGRVVLAMPGVLRSFPILVLVAAYSQFIAAMMIPSKVTGDLLDGMWWLLSQCIGVVPRTLLWDNKSGIGQRGRLADGVAGFCGVLGTRLIQARITRGATVTSNRSTIGYEGDASTATTGKSLLEARVAISTSCQVDRPPDIPQLVPMVKRAGVYSANATAQASQAT